MSKDTPKKDAGQKAEKKAPRDFMSHLIPTPPKDTSDESRPLTQRLPAPPPAPRIEYTNISSRVTVRNDLMLARVQHYKPGATKQQLLNDALTMLFNATDEKGNKLYPEQDMPLPTEDPLHPIY